MNFMATKYFLFLFIYLLFLLLLDFSVCCWFAVAILWFKEKFMRTKEKETNNGALKLKEVMKLQALNKGD